MIHSIFMCSIEVLRRRAVGATALLYLATLAMPAAGQSPVPLADQPIFATQDVPGNLALTPSVEFPTAISVANLGNYADGTTYYGYFDPAKCYTYQYNSTTPGSSYFQPTAMAATSGSYVHTCSGKWSGNFLNWATMQTIDPFRWALTGGYRAVDQTTAPQTILEKAWGAAQGAITNFPYRGSDQGSSSGHYIASGLITYVTPFSSWTAFDSGIWSNGNMMVFSQGGSGYKSLYNANGVTDLPATITSTINKSSNTTTYRVYVRVSVCDTSVLGTAGLESNCKGYGTPSTSGGKTTYPIYKPEGLMQQYSNKIRFAALSYLNSSGSTQQGGVLREPMGYIGPTFPTPLSMTVTTNSRAEWDPNTGIMSSNPDTTTATGSGVSQSGVMNFLNKFGEYGHSYMTYDNVSELYYAAVRYFENLGNVSQWDNSPSQTALDGFPAVVNWVDPILYRCQKNFILGIGDDHTWYDYNVGGSTVTGSRPMPSAVASDTVNKAHAWTQALETLQSLEGNAVQGSPSDLWPFDSGTTYYIAGLAYGTHVLDIRADLDGPQTISTYWMDVAEYQRLETLNPYYLAAKYGGFTVPSNYSMSNNTTPLTQSWWDTSNNTINMNGTTENLPDNYFPAGSAGQMVTSLTTAFRNIANSLTSFTTAFAPASPVIPSGGAVASASKYDSTSWTSVITGFTLSVDANGNPVSSALWASNTTLESQLAGTGWQTKRRVVTWNGSVGVPFEAANLTSTQLNALVPSSYSSATTSTQYLNYLRGDRTNEVGSTASGSTKSLRARTLLLGDIVDADLLTVGAPAMSYSDLTNPGYGAFKNTNASRPIMVYAAGNDGMLHAFVGSTGAEQFAYVPSALFQGPSGTPQVDGLAGLGNPTFSHHYYVDATPIAVDVDLNRVQGNPTGSGTPSWHTLLIGGLGKGGKSFYAIDVTNPTVNTTETTTAQTVKWEFTDSTMGYSFGTPRAFKTVKYGWVVALTSGYDNSDGYGYLYLVNPSNGTLLEKIKTPLSSNGLAQAMGFAPDGTDYTADSVYAGDLNGQLWRFDLRGTSGSYPAPTLIAALTDPSGTAQPITVYPTIAVHPTNRLRYVMLGTGRMLSTQDVSSTQTQTFYAIIDGTAGAFNPVSTPITRSTLTQAASFLNPPVMLPPATGWYHDLPEGRVLAAVQENAGYVIFSALIPSTDPCSPSGSSDVYGFNYATAQTALFNTLNNQSVPAQYIHYGNAVIDLGFYSANNAVEALVGTNDGKPGQLNGKWPSLFSTRILNWTDLPTAE